MERETQVRYVDTSTASVKMTGGVLVTGNLLSDSEDEFENGSQSVSPVRKLESAKVDGAGGSKLSAERKGDSPSSRRYVKRNSLSPRRYVKRNEGQNINDSTKHSARSSEQKNSLSNLKADQNSIIIQRSANEQNSVTQEGYECLGNCANGTSHVPPNSRHDGSEEHDAPTAAGVKHPVYIPTDKAGIRAGIKIHATGISSSSSSPEGSAVKKASRFVASRSSVSPKDQCHPGRLSHSFENSKESTLKQWERGLQSSNSLSAISDVGHKNKWRPTRINPFNNDLVVDEDHFSDTVENYFRTDRRSTGSTKSSSVSQGPDWWQEESDISFAELGLSEDHFSHPQGHFGLSGAEELELAIENCKEMIREAAPGSDKQKNLVVKLVQLRIKLQEVKEGPEPVPDNVKVILSHKMMLRNSRTSKHYCERCNSAIWGMLQVWYRCTECGYRCHEKCLQQILRKCAKAKVLENPTMITEICPKDSSGLAAQNFRCWECQILIFYKNGHGEPRLCDYTGRYYCEFCHWNDTFVIPARVLHNWDFTPRKVCRASKQFLKLMQKKAVLRLQDINPMLFVFIDQLNEIKKLREEMMIMKKYILSCAGARSAKLLLLLETRQHFVESSDRYSMQDLLDAEDVLQPELASVHSTWAQHIKMDCQLCQGRGFCCELCGDKEVLFPFDSTAVVCAKCSTVLHRQCFAKTSVCPRCERRQKKKVAESESLDGHSKS